MQRFQLEQLQAELAASRQSPSAAQEPVSPSNTDRKRAGDTSQTSANKKRKVVRAPVEFEAEEDLASLHESIGQDGV